MQVYLRDNSNECSEQWEAPVGEQVSQGSHNSSGQLCEGPASLQPGRHHSSQCGSSHLVRVRVILLACTAANDAHNLYNKL